MRFRCRGTLEDGDRHSHRGEEVVDRGAGICANSRPEIERGTFAARRQRTACQEAEKVDDIYPFDTTDFRHVSQLRQPHDHIIVSARRLNSEG